ncbi:MAG TPA: hypothetical protein P5531_13120 [Bacteroidales bacterium]|nr:hypothetical protein [Bacteroidales bacterium]HSA44476.1 hypothetical protein [Bacteroidales bacterium]
MKLASLFLFVTAVLLLPSCDVVQQAQKVGNLINCDFSLKSVENISLAGVSLQQVQTLSSLNVLDAGRLTAALAGGALPLSFTLNVQARNPNKSAAGMNRLEWILLIDDIEMTKGTLNRQINIPANNGTSVIPLQMNFDLKKVLSNRSGDALLNFALGLAGTNNKPSRISLKAKPTISVSGYSLDYPGYITITP